MKLILGIDPGLSGALALLGPTGKLKVYDMPVLELKRNGKLKRELDLSALGDLLYDLTNGVTVRAFVEKVGAMPGQGVSSMFSFGKTYGATLGILAAFQIPVSHVAPQTWQKALQVRGGKDGSRARASELMPCYAEVWKLKKHDGRAEAALISYYGDKQGETK